MPPMLVRDGEYWRLNAHVQPDSDFFTVFITPHWNEVLNPNMYGFTSRARLRAIVRTRCADVLDWYRDEHGRRLRKERGQIDSALCVVGDAPPVLLSREGQVRFSFFAQRPFHLRDLAAVIDGDLCLDDVVFGRHRGGVNNRKI